MSHTTVYLRPVSVAAAACMAIAVSIQSSHTEEIRPRVPITTESLNTTHQLIGPLGKPLGEVLVVTAIVDEFETKGYFKIYATITSVNGIDLAKPLKMPVEIFSTHESEFENVAVGQRLKVYAYQDGRMLGCPEKVMDEEMVQDTNYHFLAWIVAWKHVSKE